METILAQLQTLADGAPADLIPTAKTILVVRSTLAFKLETPGTLATQLRRFAAENRRTATRLSALPATATLFEAAADLHDRAADIIEPPARAEVA